MYKEPVFRCRLAFSCLCSLVVISLNACHLASFPPATPWLSDLRNDSGLSRCPPGSNRERFPQACCDCVYGGRTVSRCSCTRLTRVPWPRQPRCDTQDLSPSSKYLATKKKSSNCILYNPVQSTVATASRVVINNIGGSILVSFYLRCCHTKNMNSEVCHTCKSATNQSPMNSKVAQTTLQPQGIRSMLYLGAMTSKSHR
jgi:hypothetical protein